MESCGSVYSCIRAWVQRGSCHPGTAALTPELLHLLVSSHVIAWPSYLLLCHCLTFHIALLCHNQLFKCSHAHHVYLHLAPTPDLYLEYLCPLHTPAMATSSALTGDAKGSWRGKARPIAVLRDSTGTMRRQDLHVLLKSEILIVSHWECICTINCVETHTVEFEICSCVSSSLAGAAFIGDCLSDDVQTGK